MTVNKNKHEFSAPNDEHKFGCGVGEFARHCVVRWSDGVTGDLSMFTDSDGLETRIPDSKIQLGVTTDQDGELRQQLIVLTAGSLVVKATGLSGPLTVVMRDS